MGNKTGVAADDTDGAAPKVVPARRVANRRSPRFRHPAYRIRCEDEWDHVIGHELRILPGDFLHVKVHTLYKHPTVTEARGGVAISFGENTCFVTIDNLNRAYRLFMEPTWYGVEIIYAPVAFLEEPPVMRDMFYHDEQIVGGTHDHAHK